MYIVQKDLNVQLMEKVAEKKMTEKYTAIRKNCVDAVAKTLIAGGLPLNKKYKKKKIPTPGEQILKKIRIRFENILRRSPLPFVLSRASEVGSPTNPPWAPGSDKTRGQGALQKF